MPTLIGLFIKPEGTALLKELEVALLRQRHELNADENSIVDGLVAGVNVLKNESYASAQKHQQYLYVESGLLSHRLFDIMYPRSVVSDHVIREKMRIHYVNNRYNLILFRIESDDSLGAYEFLQKLKGKMSSADPNFATGLRGDILRQVLRLVPYYRRPISQGRPLLSYYYGNRDHWLETGNFLHIPDSESESKEIQRYVEERTKRQRDSFEVLYSNGKQRLSIWDIYKIADQQLYLDEVRTADDLRLVCSLLPLTSFPRILDIGCGDGRIAIRMATAGYGVVGIDFDGKAVARAVDQASLLENANVLFQVWSFASLSPKIFKHFDAAIITYAALTSMTKKEFLVFLRKIYLILRPGGALVMDFLSTETLRKSPSSTKVMSEIATFADFGIAELKRQRVFDSQHEREKTIFSLRTSKGEEIEVTYEHNVPSEPTLRRLLMSVGFSTIYFNPERSWACPIIRNRMTVVARK